MTICCFVGVLQVKKSKEDLLPYKTNLSIEK